MNNIHLQYTTFLVPEGCMSLNSICELSAIMTSRGWVLNKYLLPFAQSVFIHPPFYPLIHQQVAVDAVVYSLIDLMWQHMTWFII